MTDQELIERLGRWLQNIHYDDKPDSPPAMMVARLQSLTARVAELERENFSLAAGACNVDRGLIGDEHGHFYCRLERELTRLKAVNEELVGALEPFGNAEISAQLEGDDDEEWAKFRLLVKDYRRAAQALSRVEQGEKAG